MNKIVAPGITQAHKPFHHEAMEKEANRGEIYVTALYIAFSLRTLILSLFVFLSLSLSYWPLLTISAAVVNSN